MTRSNLSDSDRFRGPKTAGRVGRPPTSGQPSSAVPLDVGSASGRLCLVDGCDAVVYARSRCRKHYRRFMAAMGTDEQREFDRQDRNHGNASRKNTICVGCGKLCWGNSRKAPKQDYLCWDCRYGKA
jgi:hypothetical protein